MARPGGAWVADGRAKTIRADCEASLAALDGLPIDLYLIHAPDPRTPWRTSVRALARLVDDGLVAARRRLERQPPAARRGARARSDRRGPGRAQPVRRPCASRRDRRAVRGARDHADRALAARRPAAGETTGRTGPKRRSPGCCGSRPRSSRSPARRVPRRLGRRRARPRSCSTDDEAAALDREFDRPETPKRAASREDGEVVVVMGIPGAGKTRLAEEYVGARLPAPQPRRARRLAARARCGARRGACVGSAQGRPRQHVPDSRVAELRGRSGEPARRRRAVRLARHAARAGAGQPRRADPRPGRRAPDARGATRADARGRHPRADLADADGQRARAAVRRRGLRLRGARPVRAGVDASGAPASSSRPAHVGRTRPSNRAHRFSSSTGSRTEPSRRWQRRPPDSRHTASAPVETAICAHAGGPPVCWCRPPLPGLPLAFARVHGVDPSRSLLVGTGPAHRTLANTLGARYIGL